jgi:hypothetical protein
MAAEPPVLDRGKRLFDIGRQVGKLHRLVDDRPVARDRLTVGGKQRDRRGGHRLERFRQRRRERQPDEQNHEQQQESLDAALDPPQRPRTLRGAG